MLNGLRTLEDPGAFSGWAYRLVTFKSVDYVRRRQRQRRIEEQQMHPDPVTTDEADDEIEALRAALGDLSAEQRAILSLHYREELGIGRIAEILGIPAGTVKSRLHHARAALKKKIERRQR